MNAPVVRLVGGALFAAIVIAIGIVWLNYRGDEGNNTAATSTTTPTPTVNSTPASSPVPTENLPASEPTLPDEVSQVQVFLVATGDPNAGQAIGCGDGLVTVDRQIQPTVAPLGAAYRELLGMTESDVSQSGLYNALQQSNLTYDKASVEDGVARVFLTGELRLGGECDSPRVKAQLEQMALQFSTVDEAEIFINNQPLTDQLNLQGQ